MDRPSISLGFAARIQDPGRQHRQVDVKKVLFVSDDDVVHNVFSSGAPESWI